MRNTRSLSKIVVIIIIYPLSSQVQSVCSGPFRNNFSTGFPWRFLKQILPNPCAFLMFVWTRITSVASNHNNSLNCSGLLHWIYNWITGLCNKFFGSGDIKKTGALIWSISYWRSLHCTWRMWCHFKCSFIFAIPGNKERNLGRHLNCC